MAKKAKGNRVQVILECTEHKDSGMPGTSRYITTKNRKNTTERLELKKYNPILKAVLDERGWELYFEGNRRQDLIRYGLFVEAIKKKAQSMGKQTLVDEDRYRFPIPQDIIDEGQGIIKQNPGY